MDQSYISIPYERVHNQLLYLFLYVVSFSSCCLLTISKTIKLAINIRMYTRSICLCLLLSACLSALSSVSLCPQAQTRRYIDISLAKIQKSSVFQYSLQLYDTITNVTITGSEAVLTGNFSRLILNNAALRKPFVYWGRQMIIRAPADHIFSMQKIPELEIQIIHEVEEVNRANPYNYVLVSQLYMVSKFSSKVETHLGEYLNAVVRGGGVLRTEKLVKLIDGFPMLMYKGTTETFPCRVDLLCFLKREYQLISLGELEQLKQLLEVGEEKAYKKKVLRRRNLYQIGQIREGSSGLDEL